MLTQGSHYLFYTRLVFPWNKEWPIGHQLSALAQYMHMRQIEEEEEPPLIHTRTCPYGADAGAAAFSTIDPDRNASVTALIEMEKNSGWLGRA